MPPQNMIATQGATTEIFGVPPDAPTTLDLSGEWRVETMRFLNRAATQADFDDSAWRVVTVPAHWSEQEIEADAAFPMVAVYRRMFSAPVEWKGQQIGVAAWIYPGHSTVTLNGAALEAAGESPWLYAEVTDLLRYDADNLIVVTSQFDGVYELTFPNPPRIGVLGTWDIPALDETPLDVTLDGATVSGTVYALPSDAPRPGVLMIGTGSHGLAFTEEFVPLARELAYNGYAAFTVALPAQTPENIGAALDGLRGFAAVDPDSLAVIAATASATTMLQDGIDHARLKAIVTLSAGDAKLATDLTTPTLLIAATNDPTGPAAFYAEDIAAQLTGDHEVLIVDARENGLALIDPRWNAVRAAVLRWFDAYLRRAA